MEMSTTKPLVDEWYQDTSNGQPFLVVSIDDDAEIIDIQYYDGNIGEISFGSWETMELEHCAEPENWTGSYDVSDADTYEADDIDASEMEWNEPYEDR